jgi:hypothetical protein
MGAYIALSNVFPYDVIYHLRFYQYLDHGGPFFGSAAIFSVLKSLEVRDTLCVDQLHLPNRAALCSNL